MCHFAYDRPWAPNFLVSRDDRKRVLPRYKKCLLDKQKTDYKVPPIFILTGSDRRRAYIVEISLNFQRNESYGEGLRINQIS